MAIIWQIDSSHSRISFSVKHLELIEVSGNLMNYNGHILQKNLTDFLGSTFQFKGWLSSVSTGNQERDEHLYSQDFFDIQNYDCVKFKSQNVHQIDKEHYFIEGLLSLKENSEIVTMTAHYKGKKKGIDNNDRIGFEITGFFNRTNFGIDWQGYNQQGTQLISEQVQIHIYLQLLKTHIK